MSSSPKAKDDLLESAVSRVFQMGVHRRRAFGFCLTGLTLLGGLLATQVRMEEDVAIMLPDSDPAFVASYRLFKAAPFARSVLIDLEASEDGQVPLLTQTAERLSERLGEPYVSEVVGALPLERGTRLLDWLYAHMPQLFTEADAAALAAEITPERVEAILQENLLTLSGPEGLWLRRWLVKDPLGFRNRVFRKLGAVAMLPDAGIETGFLVDPTGRHVLVLAETPIPMEDSLAGEELLKYLDEAIAETVPDTLATHVVCAHRYTVANAQAIKRDLVVVFIFSAVSLTAIFILLLRRWRAAFVFATPLVAILAGMLATAGVFGTISAITVGFGAVLLGISVDYGLHVFFALSRPQIDRADCMGRLAVPMVVSCATTVGVFAVLLGSGVPIQRQLAVFSIAGLVTAMVLAVVWLPHWIAADKSPRWMSLPAIDGKRSRWIVAVWLLLLLISLPLCFGVTFDADLRGVGLMPAEVLADEYCIRDVWSDPRGRALVVAQSDDVETALLANEQAYTQLAGIWGTGELVSLAPLVPSAATQSANIARWRRFWQEDGRFEALRETLNAKGRAVGFAANAFESFFESLEHTPEPFGVTELQEIAGPLLAPLFMPRDEGLGLISLVPDNEQTVEAFGASGLDLPPGVNAVSQRWFGSILRKSLTRDFKRFLLIAIVAVVIVLAVALRRLGQVILCLLPAVTGFAIMLAVMGLLGMRVNLFNVAASVLVIGLSIDYGVFMVRRPRTMDGAAERAVAASALTTLCGFGALSLARHPAMFSLGITVVLGIIPAMMCALWVVPVLGRRARYSRSSCRH